MAGRLYIWWEMAGYAGGRVLSAGKITLPAGEMLL